MICSRCHRPLKSAAVISGGLTIGPTCARILGIAIRTVRQRRPATQAGQLALFESTSPPMEMLA